MQDDRFEDNLIDGNLIPGLGQQRVSPNKIEQNVRVEFIVTDYKEVTHSAAIDFSFGIPVRVVNYSEDPIFALKVALVISIMVQNQQALNFMSIGQTTRPPQINDDAPPGI